MSVSEMEQIGYESAMSEVSDMIKNALKNEQLDTLPASMALRVLLASIKMSVDDDLQPGFELRTRLENRGSKKLYDMHLTIVEAFSTME